MRTLGRSLAVLGLAAALMAPAAAPAASAQRYIVVLSDATSDPGSVASQHARHYGAQVSYVYRAALKGYAAAIPSDRVAELRADPRVAYLSLDRELHALAQSLPTGIDRIQSDVSTQQSGNGDGSVSGPAVAVIDTGSGPHPDINVVGGVNCSTGPSYNDGNGHGSHVAGTIGAFDNGQGVVGVAPGVPIYSVRVLNNAGSGTWASVICGVEWVTTNAATLGIKVANMSLGGSGGDGGDCATTKEALQQAICAATDAGVLFVVAAGNSKSDLNGFVPATYNQALTVTAAADFNGAPGGGAAATCRTDVDDTAADFSNFTEAGSTDESHTIAAPGVCILSTWKGGGYKTISGTSMATPHVTGAAALCIASGGCAGKTPAQIIDKLRTDAAAQPASYGFVGDPYNPLHSGKGGSKTLYYGYLLYAGGY